MENIEEGEVQIIMPTFDGISYQLTLTPYQYKEIVTAVDRIQKQRVVVRDTQRKIPRQSTRKIKPSLKIVDPPIVNIEKYGPKLVPINTTQPISNVPLVKTPLPSRQAISTLPTVTLQHQPDLVPVADPIGVVTFDPILHRK